MCVIIWHRPLGYRIRSIPALWGLWWTGLPVEERVRVTEDRDKCRKYVHGVANPRIEDGERTEQKLFDRGRLAAALHMQNFKRFFSPEISTKRHASFPRGIHPRGKWRVSISCWFLSFLSFIILPNFLPHSCLPGFLGLSAVILFFSSPSVDIII